MFCSVWHVYQPSEEEVMVFLDPYVNIVFLDCNEAGNGDLLLLCDCYDTTYHTYCVGLGRAILEGNWYFQGYQTSIPKQYNKHDEDVDDLQFGDISFQLQHLVGFLKDISFPLSYYISCEA